MQIPFGASAAQEIPFGASAAQELPRASAVQRYTFVRRLAVGGMAEVYVAESVGVAGVRKRVALKRILPSLATDSAFVTMFLNEARIASTLQHPNIVQTLDVIDDGGEYTIVMELLEGLTLHEVRQRIQQLKAPMTCAHLLYAVDRVLAGLNYAHERLGPDDLPMNLVHRDVSPHNVFLGRDGNVKLLDFGVAKAEAALVRDSTGSGVVKGKALYMSPEQCQGTEVDRRSDIYAVGVLLYVFLTGQHPFKGANPYDTMRSIIYGTAPPPSSLVPSLGADLDALVTRAMAKDPADRFATARDMQRAIGRIVRDRSLYVTDVDFAAFVEGMLGVRAGVEPDTRNLPADIVIGNRPYTAPTPAPAAAAPRAETLVAETETALVERVNGVTVFTLRGPIDERFDTSVGQHLRGVLLVDSGDVTRITSYGIRALLDVIEASATKVDAVFHVRASVPYLEQVAMIGRLLFGGKVVSFALPYLDPVTRTPFVHAVSGEVGQAVLVDRRPPSVPCPGAPGRLAEFDEDPESYLWFLDSYCVEPPPHVALIIEALAAKDKRRQVEKEIVAGGLLIHIRRPIDETFRWRTLLAGIEGRVKIDLDATPTWTDAGLERLYSALEHEVNGIESLEVTHLPLALYEKIRAHPKLGGRLRAGSVRVHAACPRCAAPRRVAVDVAVLDAAAPGDALPSSCPVCRQAVRVTLGSRVATPDPAPQAPAPSASRRWLAPLAWGALFAGLLGIAGLVAAVGVAIRLVWGG